MMKRDYQIGTASEHRRLFYVRPFREWAKWSLLLLKSWGCRYLGSGYQRLAAWHHQKSRGYAREVSHVGNYVGGGPFFEIQIGNQTRPCAVVEEGSLFEFETTGVEGQEFLFGIAPLVDPFDPDSVKKWGAEVSVVDLESGESEKHEILFPYDGWSECFAYFAGDGWIDCRYPLGHFVGKRCRVTLRPNCQRAMGLKKRVEKFAISTPEVMTKKKKESVRNILLISFESLTDVTYLRRRYGLGPLPALDSLCQESVVYPQAYSPTDSTLSFAASFLTGLLSSQHGIGNYAIGADTFDNNRFSEKLTPLSEVMKQSRFLTFFGGTQVRYSSKMGWARGFDQYFHVFEKWGPNVPQFPWVTRLFHELSDFDKFVCMHIDFLHDPLLAFNESVRPRFLSVELLASGCEDDQRQFYFDQLRELDFQLGRFLDYLKSKGIFDQTAILLTGDHGCGLNWVKHSDYALYEERIRVPLIIKYPSWTKGRIGPRKIVNSVSEIHRVLYAILGSSLPDYLRALPQYDAAFENYAFAETIMNPNRQYKRHNLAIMNDPYKYVCWNEVDWDRFQVEKFGREAFYQWDEASKIYREEENVASRVPQDLQKYREMARRVIESNLKMLEKFPPRKY